METDLRRILAKIGGKPVPDSAFDRAHPVFSRVDTMRLPREFRLDAALLRELIAVLKRHDVSVPSGIAVDDHASFVVLLGELSRILAQPGTPRSLRHYMPVGAHGYALSYDDSSIRTVHGHAIDQSPDGIGAIEGKCTILQQATRGCASAAAWMLILNDRLPGESERQQMKRSLRTTSLRTDESMVSQINDHGLGCDVSAYSGIASLKAALENGTRPAIVSVSSGVGAHAIVVDSVNDDGTVTIRDPAHGWRIDITVAAFEASRPGGNIIQIAKPA